jgi:S1-C subfamily serine protease
MVTDQEPVAPQVVTIVHRINGVTLLNVLSRNRNQLGAVTISPDAVNNDVHASIIAGVALADGKTIAARLPQVAAEMQLYRFSLMLPGDDGETDETGPATRRRTPRPPRIEPDLTVMTQDGKTFRARYVGIDGSTGLSVLQLTTPHAPAIGAAMQNATQKISQGQNVQLFAPERVASDTPYTIYVRIGKTEATVAELKARAKADLDRVMLRGGAKLSPNVMGGVALDQSGNTMGIIDAIEGNQARLLTAHAVNAATKRVLEEQSSVPRPLLGIRGEEVDSSSKQTLIDFGWTEEQFEDLVEKEVGIVLTSVLPGTPAASAKLKPGDVIVCVDGKDVKGAEGFTEMLTEAGSGEDVKITVERPQMKEQFSVNVKLGSAYQTLYHFEMPKLPNIPNWTGGLRTFGINARPLSTKSASQWGTTGVLVVGVEPESAAARAGLKEGDVIQMINGRFVGRGTWTYTFQFNKKEKQVLSVVRQKEKKQVVIEPLD